jgi:hypothetical protein
MAKFCNQFQEAFFFINIKVVSKKIYVLSYTIYNQQWVDT